MKISFVLFSTALAWFSGEPLPRDADLWETFQLRTDQLYRDAIEEHRKNVQDTDKRNPGHMEFQFRRDLNQKLTDMIGTDNSTRTIHKTEMRFKMTFSRFNAEDSRLKPVIIYGHGGGYVAGSVDLYSRFFTWLAKETNCIVVAPHYRLAPRRMWPGQFDDLKEVIEYVYDNAEDLSIDKNKIIISGDGIGAGVSLAAALQLGVHGRKVGEAYETIPLFGSALLQPQLQMINFDTPSYKKYNDLTLRRSDIGFSMSALFGGERDYDLIEEVKYGHIIHESVAKYQEMKFVDPQKWLSKKTLGDFIPETKVYEQTEHMWEQKLKNRITNGSVSPLAQYDRMFKVVKNWLIFANERDILHDEAEMLATRLKSLGQNAKFFVEKKAMHNNFMWSTPFSGNPLVTPGNAQLENFAKQIQSITTSITRKEEL